MADPTSISGMHWSKRKAEEVWQWREESWPRGALTPATSDKTVVGKNGDFILTKVKLARRWGGGGRGKHGEALGELGDAFLLGRGS